MSGRTSMEYTDSASYGLAASKAFALCCTLDAALVYRDELAFLQAVKAALTKHGGPCPGDTLAICNGRLRDVLFFMGELMEGANLGTKSRSSCRDHP